jgi:hypothetical protein
MSLQSFRHLDMVRALVKQRHFGRVAKALGGATPPHAQSAHLENRKGDARLTVIAPAHAAAFYLSVFTTFRGKMPTA